MSVVSNLFAKSCFFLQSILSHFFFIIALGIGYIAECPEHFIFRQFLHNLCKIIVFWLPSERDHFPYLSEGRTADELPASPIFRVKILDQDSAQPDLIILCGGEPVSTTPGTQLEFETGPSGPSSGLSLIHI